MLGGLFTSSFQAGRRSAPPAAIAAVEELPAYQIALWPDGWDLEANGTVHVRDTHEMAEARRWYEMAARNAAGRPGAPAEIGPMMRLHGVFVPRQIVDMAGCTFPTERVASVAMHLVAGDWIRTRRRQLLADPQAALAQRALAWCGSRHRGVLDAQGIEALLAELLSDCISEGLLPKASYGIDLRDNDGYGVRAWRCIIRVHLDPYARARAAEALRAALIPWNRAIIRDGRAVQLIELDVQARRRQRTAHAAGSGCR